jgi:Holliday junction resolvase RusA-like endonuclease
MTVRNFTEEWLNGRLDKARVKEQSPRSFTLEPQEIYLPFPPSVNAAYANVAGKGRVKSERYRSWERVAKVDLARQKPKRIKGPVYVTIYLEDSTSTRGDADNRIKVPLDFIASNKLIEDDHKHIVRSVQAIWSSETKGCRVSIRPAPISGGAE